MHTNQPKVYCIIYINNTSILFSPINSILCTSLINQCNVSILFDTNTHSSIQVCWLKTRIQSKQKHTNCGSYVHAGSILCDQKVVLFCYSISSLLQLQINSHTYTSVHIYKFVPFTYSLIQNDLEIEYKQPGYTNRKSPTFV